MSERVDRALEVGPATPRRRRRWRVSIGFALGLGIALLVAAPLAIVIILNAGANRDNTFSLLNHRVLLMVDAIETGTRRHFEAAAQTVDFIADLHREGLVDLTDRPAALPVLKGASAALESVEALIVYRGERQLAGVFRTPYGEHGEIPAGPELDADVRRALTAAESRAEPMWGPLVFRDERVYANYGAPLERDGVRDGLLVAAVSLTTLSEILSDISTKFATTAFVLDADGRVVAHPNLSSPHPEVTAEAPTVRIDRVGDLVLAAYARREPLDEFADASRQGVEVSEVEVAGEPNIIMTRKLAGIGPRPWTVGAHFTGQDVGDEVRRLVGAVAVSAIAFVVALVLAFVTARLVARPIRRFATGAALITDLDLDHVEALPASRIREIDEGAVAFNAMLDGLRAFAAYVPKTLVTRLVHSGIKATTQSVERELTIMFTDIVGFTTLAETLSAAEAAHLLNHHFRILTRIVEAHGGTVDKFMGDGLMAFWGAPEQLEGHAEAACRAALEIAEAVRSDNARRLAEGGPAVRVGIGIHTGPVIVGNIGGGGRVNYTVIGDTVNACERLQQLGRSVPGEPVSVILASEVTMARAGPGFVTEAAGSRALRGRTGELTAFRLLGQDPGSADPDPVERSGPAAPAERKPEHKQRQ